MSGLEPGFQLGHYRILRSLGSGGMADVYEAHDDHLDRTVALKILPVEYSRNPQLVQRFQKEVRAAAKLNHRNIVTVFEVGHQDSWHFFSMRLLTGGDLRDRIQRGLTPVEALAILRELADAFAHAHARGFVHRDVKPENVMFDEQGFPVLTDFGIAKALNAETRMTRTGMTMGTPRYLAPEQASGKPVDARADLYSLGVILHEMLTGRPPYDAEESMAVIFKHVTEPIPVMPQDFARYQPLLEKLMAKDPNQRIGSAEDLIREIDAVAPRTPTGEIRQSQLRTAENPLIANLLTPSPLRTPAPKTPRPVSPTRDSGIESGEVVVRPTPVTTRPPARPAPAPAPAAAPAARAPAKAPAVQPAAPAAAPRRVWPAALGAGVLAIALAGAGVVGYRMLQAPVAPAASPTPAAVTAPAQPDPKAAAAQEAARKEQLRQEQARRDAAAAEARKAEEQAAARKLAEQQAAEKQAADKRAAELQAKQRAAAEAEAQRQAAAEAEARKKADAEARKKAEADAEARRWAEVEAANKRREAEAEREAAAKRQADEEAAAAEAARKKKEDAARQQAAKEAEEEKKAKERTRRPTGF